MANINIKKGKTITFLLFVFSFLIFFLPKISLAANWYVDNAATGSNNGTSWTNAWQSFAVITWGGAGIVAGDTLYISGGTTGKTYTERLVIGASGSSGNPITIKVGQSSPHNGIVILEGNTVDGIASNRQSWVTISGQLGGSETPNMIVRNHTQNEVNLNTITGIVMEYLEIGPHITGGAGNGHCVKVSNSYLGGSNRIHHNKIHDCYDYGIVIYTISGTAANDDYLRIYHNEIYNLGHDGIHDASFIGGITIDHNDIHTAISGPLQIGTYIDGMHLRSLHYMTVSHNKIYDLTGPDSMYGYIYFEADTGGPPYSQENVVANDIYIYNNIIYETVHYPSDGQGEGILFLCKDCISVTNVSIVNNTILDVNDQGIIWGTWDATSVSNAIIANNIIYNVNYERIGSSRYMVSVAWNSPQTITTGSFGDSPTPDVIWDYNLIDVFGSNQLMARIGPINTFVDYLTTWKTTSGADAHGVTADPAFTNWTQGNSVDLHLAASDTEVMNKGVSRTEFTDDYDGISRPQGLAWDIGAYEYIASGPTPDTTPPAAPTGLTVQ